MARIPYGRQSIDQTDLDAVSEALTADYLTQGPRVPEFERAIAGYCGAQFGVAVNSGTSALHVAYLALGMAPGKRVWTVPNSFVATANAALYCGATVDFVDIDAHSLCLDVAALAAKLAAAAQDGRLPDLVVPVHFAGRPCDMAAIGRLARQYGFRVVEDAAHALGATYQGRTVGGCAHSDIAILSFHPVKIITTGEGGMALTNDPALARAMDLLRSHGITKERAEFTTPPAGDWAYEQQLLGFNYRLTDLAAVLGLSQFGRLEAFLGRRRAIAARYDALLEGLDVRLPARAAGVASSWHLYVVQLPGGAARRKRVFDGLRARGIGVQVLYTPIHLQPYYRALGFKPGDFPVAERYADCAFTLPIYPGLSDTEQDTVVEALKALLDG